MPRTPPPAGYLNLMDAVNLLNSKGLEVSNGMIYKWVRTDRLHKYGPEARKQKYYKISELLKIVDEEQHAQPGMLDASFARATLNDLQGITDLSQKIFNTPTITPISTETRRSWLLTEPRGHYIVKTPNGAILAYLHILALTDPMIRAYMAGEIMSRHITGDDVQQLVPGRPQSCIVASISSDPDLSNTQRSKCTSMLLHGVSKDLALLGLQGIIIDRVYAWSESRSGISLCARMGMQQYNQPRRQGNTHIWRYTFYLEVQESTIPFVQKYKQALAEWLNAHHIPPQADFAHHSQPRSHPEKAIKSQEKPHFSVHPYKTELPDGLKGFADFFRAHHIGESTARRGMSERRFKVIAGNWSNGVRQALDEAGQRQFVEYYRSKGKLQQCNDSACPCKEM